MENINERTKEELIEEIENLQEEIKKRDKRSKYDAMAIKTMLNSTWGTGIDLSPLDKYIKEDIRITTDYTKFYNRFTIKNVIFNPPATIVFWQDGTKTVVKCGEHDIYDPEKGIAMAIAKKALGNKGNYYNSIKEWLPVDYVPYMGDHNDTTKYGFRYDTRQFYAGKSKIVCAGDCYHVKNIKFENMKLYHSLEQAIADGCRPCKHCHGKHKEEE